MLVSVVVNNYNYAHFLRDCIESVLSQTYHPTEVIVVDDGSTDGSREIISSYSANGRIKAVLKENGGQASAFNAGFRAARGELVIFLDSDDVLLPSAVEQVVSEWESSLAKIQWRLQLVDANLRPMDKVYPASWQTMPSGNVRNFLLRWGYYPSPPTSGNAFPRWVLERILPMPEEPWRIAADSYLVIQAGLLGPIKSLDRVLGFYRVHRNNQWYSVDLTHERLARNARIDELKRSVVLSASGEKDAYVRYIGMPGYWKIRLALALLAPQVFQEFGFEHKRFMMASCGLKSTFLYPYFPDWVSRIRLAMWFMLTGFLPRPIARYVARFGVAPSIRHRCMNLLRNPFGGLKTNFKF